MKKFYCYLKNGEPVILETEPKNFRNQKSHYLCPAVPNYYVAKMRYLTFLKIKNWRSA